MGSEGWKEDESRGEKRGWRGGGEIGTKGQEGVERGRMGGRWVGGRLGWGLRSVGEEVRVVKRRVARGGWGRVEAKRDG